MIDPRFFFHTGPKTLLDILDLTQATPMEKGSMTQVVHNVAPLEDATPQDIACFHNKKYLDSLKKTKAGFCFVPKSYANQVPPGTVALCTETPYRAFALVAQAFYPHVERPDTQSEMIHPSVQIGEGCVIEPNVCLKKNVVLGKNVHIGAGTVVDSGVSIGDDTIVGPQVTLSHCLIGARCIIGPGARIGQKGFGFFMDTKGHVSVPQLGRVIIEDDADIGANTTIDRGSLRDTRIGRGCRLDNLVQIAHNVVLGQGCVIVAQVGIAGSTTLGNHVIVAGQVGIAGHLTIGDGTRIAAQSGIMRDLAPGSAVAGSPSVPITEWHRQTVALKDLVKKRKVS